MLSEFLTPESVKGKAAVQDRPCSASRCLGASQGHSQL